MTANSLASVSLRPPLVSVCVERQEELSRRFATHPISERFNEVPYQETPDGLIVLDGVLAHIACERFADFPLGDHTLFVGRVTGGQAELGAPLLYFCGEYGSMRRS